MDFHEAGDAQSLPANAPYAVSPTFPTLLFGDQLSLGTESLMSPLLADHVAAPLLESCFSDDRAPWLSMIVHPPTFCDEAREYWTAHDSKSLPWIALYNAILSISAQIAEQESITITGLTTPLETSHACRTRASQCLKASDYANPTAWTVEAMAGTVLQFDRITLMAC